MGRHSIPGPDDFSDEPIGDAPEPEYGDTAYLGPDDADDADQPEYSDPGRYLRQPGYQDADLDEFADADYPDDQLDESLPPAGWRVGRRALDQWPGGHRSEGGRRGVSVGVIASLAAVIAVVGVVILWRFFGSSLSHRSDVAASRCVAGNLTVAVVADPTIADHIQEFGDRFNKSAKPIGDRCVSVHIKPADSDAVVNGFIGSWPAQLGERPALWVPGSSVSLARLEAAAGRETVSDSRSLVTSPVLLAMRPELKPALSKQNWATLPGLQHDPDALAALRLPGWGSLRLAMPIGGNSDAAFLAGEAVAAASSPPDAPASAGTATLRTLVNAQPKLADDSLAEAMNTLLRQDDPATAPVHAVVTTEQQVFSRGESLPDAGDKLTSWLPPGPVPVVDYPTVLLNGSWLSPEQMSAASEFARFAHKSEQLADLANAGFRVEGVTPPNSDVTDFESLPAVLSVGDDALRTTLGNMLTAPMGSAAVTIMVDQSMTTDEGGKSRLANVIAALDHRVRALPPDSAVGLWAFDGVEGRAVVSPGRLDEQVDGQPRAAALTAGLNNLSSTSGGAVSFTTLRLVYNQALANYRAGQRNSVLVITAGPHTDQTLDDAGLQEFIRQAVDPERPVAVNVIDFGANPDRATWEAVTRLSGGSYQNLANSNSPELASALMTLLS